MMPIILAPKQTILSIFPVKNSIYLTIIANEHAPFQITLKITTLLPKIGSQRLAYPTIFLQSMVSAKVCFFSVEKNKNKVSTTTTKLYQRQNQSTTSISIEQASHHLVQLAS